MLQHVAADDRIVEAPVGQWGQTHLKVLNIDIVAMPLRLVGLALGQGNAVYQQTACREEARIASMPQPMSRIRVAPSGMHAITAALLSPR